MGAVTGTLDTLEAALGHRFSDRGLLQRALTHASAQGPESNERLEFLGDRVLGLAMAEALVTRHPEAEEGELAPRFNALVRRETCAEIAQRLSLGPHLRMARSEAQAGGRRKRALLADAMEAVIAAIYLDAGFDAARAFILRNWQYRLEGQGEAPVDPKTALQEWAQGRGRPLPEYSEVARSGPDHAPVFTVRVAVHGGGTAEASGPSKRAAEREAAARLLSELEEGK